MVENAGGKGLSFLVGREKDLWPGKKWGLLKSGKMGCWVWEGCTFTPVPIFLGGCKFLPQYKGDLHLDFCSWMVPVVLQGHWTSMLGPLFWKDELSYLSLSYGYILCHTPL